MEGDAVVLTFYMQRGMFVSKAKSKSSKVRWKWRHCINWIHCFPTIFNYWMHETFFCFFFTL